MHITSTFRLLLYYYLDRTLSIDSRTDASTPFTPTMSSSTYEAATRVERVAREHREMKEAGTVRADPDAEAKMAQEAKKAIAHGVKAQQSGNPISRAVHGRVARASAGKAEKAAETLKATDDGGMLREGMASDTRELKQARRLQQKKRRAAPGTRDKQDPTLMKTADPGLTKRVEG